MTMDDFKKLDEMNGDRKRRVLTQYRYLFQTLIYMGKLIKSLDRENFDDEPNMSQILRANKVNLEKILIRLHRAAMQVTGELIDPKAVDGALEDALFKSLKDEENGDSKD